MLSHLRSCFDIFYIMSCCYDLHKSKLLKQNRETPIDNNLKENGLLNSNNNSNNDFTGVIFRQDISKLTNPYRQHSVTFCLFASTDRPEELRLRLASSWKVTSIAVMSTGSQSREAAGDATFNLFFFHPVTKR